MLQIVILETFPDGKGKLPMVRGKHRCRTVTEVPPQLPLPYSNGKKHTPGWRQDGNETGEP